MLAGLLACAASAHAFITTNGDRARWQQPPQPGLVACTTDLPAAACRAAVAAAFATWADAAEGALPLPPLIDGAADISVRFVRDRPDLVGVLGVTTTTTEGAVIVAAEVELNDDFAWDRGGPRGTFDVQATATHEIGHALGLAHSPDRAATMYWHYDPAGAALAADDRRGIAFLYGDAAGNGAPCDVCTVAADCAEGICLQRRIEQNRPYCARSCLGGCADEEVCVGLLSGGDACIPNGRSCGLLSNQPAGAYCWGPFQCARDLRCVVYPGDARCAADCAGPGDCPAGTACALDPVDLPRVCLPHGPGGFGQPCTWATDCTSGVCLPEGTCSAWCAGGECPVGTHCTVHPRWADGARVCIAGDAPPDAGVSDAALVDAAPVDAALVDATLVDAALVDAALVDAGAADARLSPLDAALLDATPPDQAEPIDASSDGPRLGPEPTPRPSADGCAQGTDQSVGALVLLLIMLGCFFVVRRRRPRP